MDWRRMGLQTVWANQRNFLTLDVSVDQAESCAVKIWKLIDSSQEQQIGSFKGQCGCLNAGVVQAPLPYLENHFRAFGQRLCVSAARWFRVVLAVRSLVQMPEKSLGSSTKRYPAQLRT